MHQAIMATLMMVMAKKSWTQARIWVVNMREAERKRLISFQVCCDEFCNKVEYPPNLKESLSGQELHLDLQE